MANAPILPLTELDAVNVVLSAIGEVGVNSLDGNAGTDAYQARSVLTSETAKLQMRGFRFNTEEEYPLSPDVNGRITIPSEALSAEPDGDFADADYVIRGTSLYDRENRTDVFTEAVTFKIVFGLTFEQMPPALRWYVACRAAVRHFGETFKGEPIPPSLTLQLKEAQVEWTRAEISEGLSPNMLRDSVHMSRFYYRQV